MKTFSYKGYSWRDLMSDSMLLGSAVAEFIDSTHDKVHRISHRTASIAQNLGVVIPYGGLRGAYLSVSDGQTVLKKADGTPIAVIALRDGKDFPADNSWAATTSDGFTEFTKRRADGCGIIGKYEYEFGLGYKRPGLAKKEYFREKREREAAEPFKRNKNDKKERNSKPDRRRNQAFGSGRGQQAGGRK